MNRLLVISNERISKEKETFFCDNIDMKTSPEGLSYKFDVSIIARSSEKSRSHEIKLKKVYLTTSLFSYLKKIKNLTKLNDKFLIVSISPYTFISTIFLMFLRKKPFVYLRSDGYGEYKAIAGNFGKFCYHMMFKIVSKISHLISCRDYILKGQKGDIVSPTQIDSDWLNNPKMPNYEKIKLLYVGRFRIEKGVFSLLEIISKNENYTLSIVGIEKEEKRENLKNVFFREIENNRSEMINIYDESTIFVLPSYTEGHPMVLFEALARCRPIIIFDEIKHVIGKKNGIFVCKRNFESFRQTVEYIKKNKDSIFEKMKNNKIPTKKDFIEKLSNILIQY